MLYANYTSIKNKQKDTTNLVSIVKNYGAKIWEKIETREASKEFVTTFTLKASDNSGRDGWEAAILIVSKK